MQVEVNFFKIKGWTVFNVGFSSLSKNNINYTVIFSQNICGRSVSPSFRDICVADYQLRLQSPFSWEGCVLTLKQDETYG